MEARERKQVLAQSKAAPVPGDCTTSPLDIILYPSAHQYYQNLTMDSSSSPPEIEDVDHHHQNDSSYESESKCATTMNLNRSCSQINSYLKSSRLKKTELHNIYSQFTKSIGIRWRNERSLTSTWGLQLLLVLNLLLLLTSCSLADDRVGIASAWERPVGMPKIQSLEVMCGSQHMEVHLEFDSPFHGLVASKGMYGHEGCVYVPPRSGKTHYVFNIHYDKCGTKPDNHGKFYENTVVVQYDEELIEAWDEAKRLRCEWFNDYEKTATKTNPMVISDLEIVELNFHGDNVDCWMEIQEGKGPWAPPLTGIVPLGSTLTMVIAVKDPTGEFDMRVKDCDASDGQSGNILALSDPDGCIVRPKLMGKFSKLKLDDGRATVLTYAFLSAFKFPDMLNVHLRCTVEICRHGCPDHCSKLPAPPGSHIADVHGQFSENEPIALQSQHPTEQRVKKPNSIEEDGDGGHEGPEEVGQKKPDIHEQEQNQEQQQSSEEEEDEQPQQQQQQQQQQEQQQQQQPGPHPQQRPPFQQPPPQFPSQQPPPPEGFQQYPPLPQMMRPPPPRYFGRGGPPPPHPGMYRNPPPPPPQRKLIPPGLVRQRPDIPHFNNQQPNMRHQLPTNTPPAPVFPSQIYRDNFSPEQAFEQHRKQAESVQSIGGMGDDDGVGRRGAPQKASSEEEDEETKTEDLNEEQKEDKAQQQQQEPQQQNDDDDDEEEEEQAAAQQQEILKVGVARPPEGFANQMGIPQALKGDPTLTQQQSSGGEKVPQPPSNNQRPVFPKGPRSLRARRSTASSSRDTIGVQGTFRVVSQADLNFALNTTQPSQQPVLKGRMRSAGDLVYGICLPRMGFGLIFFGLGVAALVAILIASFLAYAHYSIHHHLKVAGGGGKMMKGGKRRGSVGSVGHLGMVGPAQQQVLPFPVVIFKKMW